MNKDVLIKEREFHNKWASQVDVDKVALEDFFEACTAPENRIILNYLGDLRGKKILDLGCGLGESSVYFAIKGAEVTACDISEGMLEVASKLAEKRKVKINTLQAYSDNLVNIKNEYFDIVYAGNLLHHVDIEKTIKEVFRVLKWGGRFVSWDPLAHNPLINIYRKIATEVRTEDEHPLSMKDLKIFKKYFKKVCYETTWFLTLWIFLKFYLIERVNPNKERYWKKIISEHKRLEKTYLFLEKLDKKILRIFPFLKRYCWNIVVMCEK
jgi:ubiquinone/menaquinone biosynthesis C-methylase UbiE